MVKSKINKEFLAMRLLLCLLSFLYLNTIFAEEGALNTITTLPESKVGSWIFSGIVSNESGDHYGYFFQIQRQEDNFQIKTALIDEQTNQLKFFYSTEQVIQNLSPLNWHIGAAFMRYNPINDSWVFGVKLAKEGFNFKVDLMNEEKSQHETMHLRAGLELQTIQTSRLNGHINLRDTDPEQFVTGNNNWLAKIWFTDLQKFPHAINTTFCRLSNDNGFFTAKLNEEDAISGAVARWLDPHGNKQKMSQFISIKNKENNLCQLNISYPKLSLSLENSLQAESRDNQAKAGFTLNKQAFCVIMDQTFTTPIV